MTTATGRKRIVLSSERWYDRVVRSFRRLLRLGPPPPPLLPPPNVDYSLVHRLEAQHVRQFVEGIEDYQLADQRGRAVHVTSRYRVPADPALVAAVPDWLARNIRFGVVDEPADRLRYVPIRAVELDWDDTGTRMVIHLGSRLAAGTRATISGWLHTPGDPPAAGASGAGHRVGTAGRDDPSPPSLRPPRRPA